MLQILNSRVSDQTLPLFAKEQLHQYVDEIHPPYTSIDHVILSMILIWQASHGWGTQLMVKIKIKLKLSMQSMLNYGVGLQKIF